jgi:hypothetical protein
LTARLTLIALTPNTRTKSDCFTFPSTYNWLVKSRKLFTSSAAWVNTGNVP